MFSEPELRYTAPMLEYPWFRALYRLGPLDLPSYYVLVSLGIVAGVFVALNEARRRGLPEVAVLDLSALSVLVGLFGARLLHAVVEQPDYYFSEFTSHPFRLLELWNGGFAILGGVLLALPAAYLFCRYRRIPFLTVADVAALALPLGLAVGRLGCLFAGCCYGKPAGHPLAIHYYIHERVAPQVLALDRSLEGVGLHPTQAMLSLAGLCTYLLLVALRRRLARPGQLFGAFLLLYALTRFPIELLRADHRGSWFGDTLSTSQILVLPMAVVGMWLWFRPESQTRVGLQSSESP